MPQDLQQARERHMSWLRRTGMLKTEEEIEQLMAWGPERAGAHFHPRAREDDRLLASDFYGWMILLDGQFDGLAGQDSRRAEMVVQGLLAVLDPNAAPSAPVLAGERALADLWQRLCSGMSPAWRERAAKDLGDFITAYRTEAIHRAARMCLPVEKYLRLRFDSGGTGIILDITERLHGFEIPAVAWAHPLIQRMRELTVHVTDVVQDVLSLDKEELDSDLNNIVVVLTHDDPSLTPQAAVTRVQTMVQEWTREFLALQARAGGMCDALDLPGQSRTAVFQYIDAMRSCMRGNYDWCRTSPRYDPRYLAGRSTTGLLGTMLYGP
ncbi:hypothetical protein ACFW7J_26810 [Streptomyces sp. NPDC059525]|uniref:terpene synthase family protein n=1 Tax=Streptomyces sp. NPDC059525 TaxID=3346857 RepID=UPI00369A68EB